MSENKKLTKKERYELKRQEKEAQKEREAQVQKKKKILMWSTVALVLVASLFLVVKAASSPSDSPDNTEVASQHIESSDWVKGNPEASVELLEYADFQCPACRAYYPVVKQLEAEYGDRIKISMRHFPLESIHRNAKLASQAAQAAGLQGKFWEMHDALFENQDSWSKMGRGDAEDAFVSYAQDIGLDTDKFKNDLNSEAVEKAVEEDQNAGVKAGVRGTPTFFLNGEAIDNPRGYEPFKELIEQKLQEVQ